MFVTCSFGSCHFARTSTQYSVNPLSRHTLKLRKVSNACRAIKAADASPGARDMQRRVFQRCSSTWLDDLLTCMLFQDSQSDSTTRSHGEFDGNLPIPAHRSYLHDTSCFSWLGSQGGRKPSKPLSECPEGGALRVSGSQKLENAVKPTSKAHAKRTCEAHMRSAHAKRTCEAHRRSTHAKHTREACEALMRNTQTKDAVCEAREACRALEIDRNRARQGLLEAGLGTQTLHFLQSCLSLSRFKSC